MWRDDVLIVAWGEVRRNGGAPGVDGEMVADVEARGVERWLGGLARELKACVGKPLDCVRAGHDGARMECLDPRFGLFELPIPVQDTSPAPGS